MMSKPWIPESDEGFEPKAIWHGDEYRYSKTTENTLQRSIAISLKRIADMMEEDRKPRISLAPEGYIGEQEHRLFMRESFKRDLAAWESIADAVTYIAGRMPLPMSKGAASADTHPKGGDVKQAPLVSGAVPHEDAGDAQISGPENKHD